MTANTSARISVNGSAVQAGSSAANGTYTMTGSHCIYNTQVIGTSYELLNLGDLGSVKMLYLENTSTASMNISVDNTDAKIFATLGPNGSGSNYMLLAPSASNASGLYIKSSAVADLIVCAFEK